MTFANNEPKLSIDMCNLSLRDNICVKYAVSSNSEAKTTLLVWDSPVTEYVYGSHTKELDSVDRQEIDGEIYQIYDYCDISAREMTKYVYARAYTKIGTNEYYSEVVKYSILKYAYNKLGKTGTATTDEKLKQLLTDILRYGASTQNYMNYQTDRLPTEEFYEINVKGGTMSDLCDNGLYLESESVTFTALDKNENGDNFLCWVDDTGKKISDSAICTIRAGARNTTYTALYGEAVDPFVKKNIYSESLYKIGLGVSRIDSSTASIESKDPAVTGVRCIVFPVEYGKTYEMHFPEEMQRLIVLSAESDPRNLAIGESKVSNIVRWVDGQPTSADLAGLLYTPKKNGEYLVIYTGWKENTPVTIIENTILAQEDTLEAWYMPSNVGDFLGNADSFADYRWSSESILENLYEPLREKYPEYITRENIGKDQSGQYDMFAYIFEPENYEQSVFLSAGMHANEEDVYFGLAHFLQEVANEDGTNPELHYLRENVRFIVIPVINVWGTHGTHNLNDANWAIRYNSTGTDLNRDFRDKTQQETKNVLSVLDKYGDSISFGIDFHTTPNDNGSDLFFNFPVSTDNACVNFKTTNHIYHRMQNEGMISTNRPLLVPSDSAYGNIAAIDGNYVNPRTLQGVLLAEYDISPITVEYMNFTSGTSFVKGSAKGLSMATEIIGNFIIQNALFYSE